MPELPEVEVIRRALAPWVVGRRIEEAQIALPRLTRRGGTPQGVAAAVTGRTVAALGRRGKCVLFDLGGESLIVRLGMTGQLLWWETGAQFRPDSHTHAHLRFSGGVFAYSAICTHQGCTLGYNPTANSLDCPCHGSTFDVANGGAVLGGPAPAPLPTYKVAISGNSIVTV